MNRKVKVYIDIMMTILLLFLNGYQFWGSMLHEWAGAIMFLLFIAHHILNYRWYQNLLNGNYRIVRIFQLIINVLLFIDMLMLMLSGIVISNHVFTFISLPINLASARALHILASYWGFILMSLHIGFHFGMISASMRKHTTNLLTPQIRKGISVVGCIIVAAYGIYVFIKRNFLTYLLLESQFVFMDFNESKILYYIDYLALMGLFVIVSYQFMKLLNKKRGA